MRRLPGSRPVQVIAAGLAGLCVVVSAQAADVPPGWEAIPSDRACLLRTHALSGDSSHPWRLHIGHVEAEPGQFLLFATHPRLRTVRVSPGTEVGLIVNDRYFRGQRVILRRGELVVPVAHSGGLQRQLEQAEQIAIGVRGRRAPRATAWATFRMGHIGNAARWLADCLQGNRGQ